MTQKGGRPQTSLSQEGQFLAKESTPGLRKCQEMPSGVGKQAAGTLVCRDEASYKSPLSPAVEITPELPACGSHHCRGQVTLSQGQQSWKGSLSCLLPLPSPNRGHTVRRHCRRAMFPNGPDPVCKGGGRQPWAAQALTGWSPKLRTLLPAVDPPHTSCPSKPKCLRLSVKETMSAGLSEQPR